MNPTTDTSATNGTTDTVSIDDTANAVETNGTADTNGGGHLSGGSASSRIALSMNPSLEDLQSDEQRRVLDTVSKVRKCGLGSVLSLPQIVVCGDQSSGKSSVLEALTEIPFPRYAILDLVHLEHMSDIHNEMTTFALALQRKSLFVGTPSAV